MISHDVVSFGEALLRLSSPRGTRLEQAVSLRSYVAGSEANVLACLARFGLRCAWMSAVPDSPLGHRVVTELRSHGIDMSKIVWASASERLGIFYVEELAAPLGVQVYYDRARSACARVDPASIDYTVVDGARLVHLTGITPALSTGARETFARLLQRARGHNKLISFDVNYRAKLWGPEEAAAAIEDACSAASILLCTRDDAWELWGFTGDPERILRQIQRRFGRTGAAQITVLTLGADGAAQLRQDEYCAAPSYPSSGAVRFGSGDAFAAGYLYASVTPMEPSLDAEYGGSTPLRFGNAAAALKRAIEGDIATITPEEVVALVRNREKGRFR